MLRILPLAALIALPLAFGAQARTVAVTGQNGGTINHQHDCSRGSGQAQCNNASTATGPNGKTYSKNRLRTTTSDGTSTTTVDRTGPNGQTNSRTRKLVVTP